MDFNRQSSCNAIMCVFVLGALEMHIWWWRWWWWCRYYSVRHRHKLGKYSCLYFQYRTYEERKLPVHMMNMLCAACVGIPSFPQLYAVLRPSGLHVSDILALCNAMTAALTVSQW